MEYRRLGKSGLKVSALSLGSWLTFGNQIDDKVAEELMDLAYDSGVNFFDNAEGYAGGKSELVMGKILKKKNWDRSSYIVSSKIFFGAQHPGTLLTKHPSYRIYNIGFTTTIWAHNSGNTIMKIDRDLIAKALKTFDFELSKLHFIEYGAILFAFF